jgi:hypothetical protein
MLGFKKAISLKDWREKDYGAISSVIGPRCECKSRNPMQLLHIHRIIRQRSARLAPSSSEEGSPRHARIRPTLFASQINTLPVFAHAALPFANP